MGQEGRILLWVTPRPRLVDKAGRGDRGARPSQSGREVLAAQSGKRQPGGRAETQRGRGRCCRKRKIPIC